MNEMSPVLFLKVCERVSQMNSNTKEKKRKVTATEMANFIERGENNGRSL